MRAITHTAHSRRRVRCSWRRHRTQPIREPTALRHRQRNLVAYASPSERCMQGEYHKLTSSGLACDATSTRNATCDSTTETSTLSEVGAGDVNSACTTPVLKYVRMKSPGDRATRRIGTAMRERRVRCRNFLHISTRPLDNRWFAIEKNYRISVARPNGTL